MSHLLIGQVQKANKGDGNTEVSRNVSPSHSQVQKTKGDGNTEVSRNVSLARCK